MFGKSKSKKAAREVASSYVQPTPTYVQQPEYHPPPMEPVMPVNHDVVSKELVMAAQGAALDNHNKELVNRVTELKQKRSELDNQIVEEESEKAKFEEHLIAIENKLQEVIQNLNRKIDMRNEYDAVIQETEAAYSRLLESSRSLLTVLERETLNIHKERRTTSEAVEAMVLM